MSGGARMATPERITIALDIAGLYGPEVDAACGVEEPTVDLWEAGEHVPTEEQVVGSADPFDQNGAGLADCILETLTVAGLTVVHGATEEWSLAWNQFGGVRRDPRPGRAEAEKAARATSWIKGDYNVHAERRYVTPWEPAPAQETTDG